MSRVKQLQALFPYLVGRKIKIYTENKSGYWAIAEVTGYTGLYLLLKNVKIWNGMERGTDRICVKWISKLEYIDDIDK